MRGSVSYFFFFLHLGLPEKHIIFEIGETFFFFVFPSRKTFFVFLGHFPFFFLPFLGGQNHFFFNIGHVTPQKNRESGAKTMVTLPRPDSSVSARGTDYINGIKVPQTPVGAV